MTKIFLDSETLSELNLTVVGVDNYARHPSTRVSLAAYVPENLEYELPVTVWEPHKDDSGLKFLKLAAKDPNAIFVCWNSTFERYILKYVLGIDLPASRFFDPMIQARHLSMPGKLEKVCKILELPEGKIEAGNLKDLFCSPAHPGGAETLFGISEPRYNDWDSHPTEWKEFIEYCRRDTEVLRKIYTLFLHHPLPPSEREGWLLDQKINDHGMPVDMELVRKMDKIAAEAKKIARNNIIKISGVENPNSGPQLIKWLNSQGYKQSNLQKPTVARALEDISISNEAAEVLELRKESAKTSDSKLQALKLATSSDGFVRDQFSYMGAARTGRWAGHSVQLQNLPRPTKELEKNLDKAVELVLAEDYQGLVENFHSVMDVVAGCIRPCFMAPEGQKFIISDLAAIEHRVVGWVSGCEAILDVHRQGRDPYLDFAETLFNTPYEKMITVVNGIHKCKEEYKDLRQLSKPPVLGCGFGLSGGEEVENEDGELVFTGMAGYAKNACGVDMELSLAHKAVKLYRDKYKEVVAFWYDLEDAAIQAIQTRRPVKLGKLVLDVHGKTFRIKLPSGRYLHYIRPRVIQKEFRGKPKDTIVFEGIGKNKSWGQEETYGGKLCENVVQGIARDILLECMKLADKRGIVICGHFHDEIAALAPVTDKKSLDILMECMRTSPAWAPNLPLGCAGFETKRYRKD